MVADEVMAEVKLPVESCVTLAVKEEEAVTVGVTVFDGVFVAVRVPVWVRVCVIVLVGVTVLLGVCVHVAV